MNIGTLKCIPQLKKNKLNQIFDYKIIRADGEERWVQVSRKVNRFDNIDCRLIVVRDITEQKKIVENLTLKYSCRIVTKKSRMTAFICSILDNNSQNS